MLCLARQRKTFIAAISVQTAILVLMIVKGWLRYGTNDDTTMAAIAGGGYGGITSPYIVNIHFLIGYVLKTLYGCLNTINWLTITYLMLYGLSFVIIDKSLVAKCHNKQESMATICVTGISLYLMLSFFSFTVVAYALLTAGMLYMWDNRLSPISVICIILAAMIRYDVLNTGIVILGVYGVVRMLCTRSIRCIMKDILLHIACMLGIRCLSSTSNMWLLNINSSERKFYKWGEMRSRALDCAPVPYNESLFSNHGFSKAAYDACYGAFYYIHDAVDENKMNLLIEWNKNRYHLHIIGFIKAHFVAYLTSNFIGIWQGVFVAVILLIMINNDRKARVKAIALYAGILAAEYACYVIQRPLMHVIMPTYVMGSLLGLLIYVDASKQRSQMRDMAIITTLTVTAFITICFIPTKYSMTMNTADVERLHEAREYIESHQDKIYFALDPGVFALSADEDMWKNRYADNRYNLAGNWEIYSVPSDVMFESYGIDGDNPGRSAPDSDRILFLHSHSEDFDPDDNYIIDLYREYYGETVRFEAIDTLSNGWGSYMLKKIVQDGLHTQRIECIV